MRAWVLVIFLRLDDLEFSHEQRAKLEYRLTSSIVSIGGLPQVYPFQFAYCALKTCCVHVCTLLKRLENRPSLGNVRRDWSGAAANLTVVKGDRGRTDRALLKGGPQV